MSMEVKMFQNKMEAELVKANAEVAMKKAKLAKDLQLAKVEADKVVAIREAELQKEVERLKELARMEKLKAKFLRKVTSDEHKVTKRNLFLEYALIIYNNLRNTLITGLYAYVHIKIDNENHRILFQKIWWR